MQTGDSTTPRYRPDPEEWAQEPPQREPVERQLAQYAFVREERDREVRLLFRDVPASEIARSFRASGATLITVGGERGSTSGNRADGDDAGAEQTALSVGHKKRPRPSRRAKTTGELTVRYFYAMGETVYTVVIISTTGIVDSVAGVYPGAAMPERELERRLAAVVTRPL